MAENKLQDVEILLTKEEKDKDGKIVVPEQKKLASKVKFMELTKFALAELITTYCPEFKKEFKEHINTKLPIYESVAQFYNDGTPIIKWSAKRKKQYQVQKREIIGFQEKTAFNLTVARTLFKTYVGGGKFELTEESHGIKFEKEYEGIPELKAFLKGLYPEVEQKQEKEDPFADW